MAVHIELKPVLRRIIPPANRRVPPRLDELARTQSTESIVLRDDTAEGQSLGQDNGPEADIGAVVFRAVGPGTGTGALWNVNENSYRIQLGYAQSRR